MYPALLRRVIAAGHRVFTGGAYDLNMIAQRSDVVQSGSLDDLLSIAYKDHKGVWHTVDIPATCDPGRTFLRKPINPLGTAIIAPGQYPASHRLGSHKGRPALVQNGPVTVRRDNDRDEIIEPGNVLYTGSFGINIHDDAGAGADASAGCIVVSREHIQLILDLVAEQARNGRGKTVTLTVLAPE